MRTLLILFLITVFFSPKLSGQKKNNGLGIAFSLIHPAKWSMQEYRYSADPTLEVLYFFPLSKKIWISGGIFAQTGIHNWEELYGHTFYDEHGMPYRFRTDFNRRLEFFSLGIPIKFEKETNSVIFNSLIVGITAGNLLMLNKADYYQSEFVANIPVTDSYNPLFWEINFGFSSLLYKNDLLTLSLLPVAGYRHESPKKHFAYYNYIFYGLGVRAQWRR